jgi:hypothetical protein
VIEWRIESQIEAGFRILNDPHTFDSESQPLAGMEILWMIPRLSYERLFQQFADWIRGGVAANCNWAEFTFRQNKCCLRRQLNYLDGPCAEERCLEVGKGKGKCRQY